MVSIQPCLLFVMSMVVASSYSAKILGVFPTETNSHYAMYGTIMRTLAAKGHSVTVATHFPKNVGLANFTEINLHGITQKRWPPIDYFLNMSYLDNVYDVINFSLLHCDRILRNQKVLNDIMNRDYDLFVVEVFGSDCFLPIAHKMKIPSVGLISSVPLPWVNDMVAFPENPAYIPIYFFPFTQRMDFFSRLINTVVTFYAKLQYEMISNWRSQEIAEIAFNSSIPPLRDLSRNFSLILVNSHMSTCHIRSWNPQLIEVGGLHIPKVIPQLPKELQTLMENSKDGVIFFSLGTIIQPNSISKEKISDIITTLGALKQLVLWKIDGEQLPHLPSNVITSTWFPQLAILCHPSTRAFISHGGLLSMQESIYCAVPILGVPLFADQSMNIAGLEEKGVAISMKFQDIEKNTFSLALRKVLEEKSYKENAVRLSRIFKERPQHPLDLAIYWIEYVLNFNGASHLRSPAHQLNWFQYYLIDVVLFMIGLTYLISKLFLYILKKMILLLTFTKQSTDIKDSKKYN